MTVKKRVIFLAVLLAALVALPVVGDESTARTKDIRAFATSLEYFTAWFDRLVDAAFSRTRVENAPGKLGGWIEPGGEIGGLIEPNGAPRGKLGGFIEPNGEPAAGDGRGDEIGGLIEPGGGSYVDDDPPSDEIGGLIDPHG